MTTTTINRLAFPKYVKSATTTTPPPAAAVDDAYIVPTGATGTWAGKEEFAAISDGVGGWVFVEPETGEKVAVGDENKFMFFDGAWKTVGPDHDWYKRGTTDAPDDIAQDIDRKGRMTVRDASGGIVLDVNPAVTLRLNSYGNVLFNPVSQSSYLYVQRKSTVGIADIDIDGSGTVTRKRIVAYPTNIEEHYSIKNVAGLTRNVIRSPDIMPDQARYGHQSFSQIAYIYIDPVNGDDANPGDTRFRPVKTFAKTIKCMATNRVNQIMIMGDLTIDTSQTYQLQEASSCVALMGATSDGASFQKRTINITGDGRILSTFGMLVLRMYNIDLVEDAARAGNEIFYSSLTINSYIGTCTHLNATSNLIKSIGVSLSYFYNTQLTPGKIFSGVPAGVALTWRYKNSNLVTG